MSLTPERVQRRLTRVFLSAFPTVAADAVPAANKDNTPGWDSLATLSLFTLADEEFGIKLGLDRIPETDSFEKLLKLVSAKTL